MSVYIKNMEMPKSCDECPCFSEYDACDVTGSWKFADEFDKGKERLPDCPIVPIPNHGRLIDADKLDYSNTDLLGNHIVYMVDIEDAPTIIPADKEGDG